MQEALSPPSERPVLPFKEFLAALFKALETENVRYCILRNYQGFLANNIGNDIDLLISPAQLPNALHAIRSLDSIRIVGYTERPCVANVFLEGISQNTASRALQIDLDLSLTWKGLPYLSADAVLDAAISRAAGNVSFFVPSPVHEAIISLFSSLLIGGWLKERYFPTIQQTFATDKSEVIAALLPGFGHKAAARLADSVIEGDRRKILSCIRPLRIALLQHSMLNSPFCNSSAIVRHYICEFSFRHSTHTRETVAILTSGDCDDPLISEALLPRLQSVAVVVEKRVFGPQMLSESATLGLVHRTKSRADASSGTFTFVAKAAIWMMKEWLSRLAGKKNLTLLIYEGGYYNQLVSNHRRQQGYWAWFARRVGKLALSPILCILLAIDADRLQSRESANISEATKGKGKSIGALVKIKMNCTALDANLPVERITEKAYTAIINVLAMRAECRLRKRFQ